MTQEIKTEVLEQLELDIKFGFENEYELFYNLRDMFDDDEDDVDESWLRNVITEKYKQHQDESFSWIKPTDFDKLANAFDELIEEKIVCLHNAGCTKQDGESDCMEVINSLNEVGVKAIGFCYYHSQDLVRAVNPKIKNLCLGFDSPTHNNNEALETANKIVAALKKYNFEVNWAGTVEQRIVINNINWNKMPDNEDWSPERVITILTKPGNNKENKNSFWKFW